jgi:hypothetical protein
MIMNRKEKTIDFISENKRELPGLLKDYLNAPLPKIPFSVEIQNLPKEIGEKFGLPEDVIPLLMLVVASAHIGQSQRIGNSLDAGLPVNLKAVICSKRSRNLSVLFRTLGKVIYSKEQDFLDEYIKRTGKPVKDEELAFMNEKITEKKTESLDAEKVRELSHMVDSMNRMSKPHMIFDQGTPDELFSQLATSADSGILMLSDHAAPLKDYLHNFTASQKVEFLRILRCASELTPLKACVGKNDWRYAASPLTNILWMADYPTLSNGLADQEMSISGFWNDFLLLDVKELSDLEVYRPHVQITSLGEWERVMKNCFEIRKANQHTLISVDAESSAAFLSFEKELSELLPQVCVELHPFVSKWLILAQKLAVNLQNIGLGVYHTLMPEFAKAGIELTKWYGAKTLHLQLHATALQHSRNDLKAEEAMLRKLKSKGPVDFRTLCRSYSKQGKEVHEPILASLLSKGLVQMGEDELIRLSA